MRTIIETLRIKSVEPIRMTTGEEREAVLKAVHYSLFASRWTQGKPPVPSPKFQASNSNPDRNISSLRGLCAPSAEFILNPPLGG